MEANLKQLIRQRSAIKHKLTSLEKHLADHFPEGTTSLTEELLNDLYLRQSKYEILLTEYDEINTKILDACTDEDIDKHFKDRDEFESKYFTVMALIKTLIDKNIDVDVETRSNRPLSINFEHSQSNRSVSNANIQSQSVNPNQNSYLNDSKLPPIRLPTYSGGYETWLEFKESFETIIHNNPTINNTQKFQYLRGSLQGDAAMVIHSLELTSSNYETAWKLLCDRFDNKCILVHNHVKSLFSLESLTKESPLSIRQLIDSVSKHLRALKTLELPTEHWDILIIHILSTKLDKITLRDWEEQKSKSEFNTLEEMLLFLRNKANMLEILYANNKDNYQITNKPGNKVKTHALLTKQLRCVICKGSHSIYYCTEFLSMSISNRYLKVKSLNLCQNCLRSHGKDKCSLGSCKKCNRFHNSLLHQDTQSQGVSNQNTYSENVNNSNVQQNHLLPSTSQQNQPTLSSFNRANQQILLSTALIQVKDSKNMYHTCRCLLDSGSMSNFITERLCNKLKLFVQQTSVSISGITQSVSNLTKKCQVTLQSMYNQYSKSIQCYVISNITDDIPHSNINVSSLDIPEGLHFADPSFHTPGRIDMLLGTTIFWELILNGHIVIGNNKPILRNTKLGWIIAGPVNTPSTPMQYCNFAKTIEANNDQLKKFWEIEEVPTLIPPSNEDLYCEKHFIENMYRHENGQFVVKIPFKYPPNLLGDSKTTATNRFLALERKLNSNAILKTQYVNFIHEYLKLGHMSKYIPKDDNITYYLPHHAVLKDSITTQLRVVFDGSSPSDTQWSLNDLQYIGPKIQNDILNILLRFRQHTFVASADISKMYRCIHIHENDKSLHLIVWRDNPNENIESFQLNTVTYGTRSAPFLAIRCLKQIALDNSENFPQACQVILNDFYVDDLLTGHNSSSELSIICKNISDLLEQYGFHLRKWLTNSTDILQHIHSSDISHDKLILDKNESLKTLGIQWISNPDVLTYKIKSFMNSNIISKRQILSDIAQIYDPLGLVSPCTIVAKILIQDLWLTKLSWDEPVPQEIQDNWNQFREQLSSLNKLSIPRHVFCSNAIQFEIHGFCDASQKSYAACIYARSISVTGIIKTQLLCAKTKVAPLKTMSIPRLELCGSLLLSQLVTQVTKALTVDMKVYFWCDSQVVLAWLNMEPSKLQVFVANRVAQVQLLTNTNNWNYVNTKQNPADIASRGILPLRLLDCTIWWQGPEWLSKPKSEWPLEPLERFENLPELKCHPNLILASKEIIHSDIFLKFSSYLTLQRVVAYCFRFVKKCLHLPVDSEFLTTQELNHALLQLIKLAQSESFKNTVDLLKKQSFLPKGHRLSSLTPFVDNDGILRVGGRLHLSQEPYVTKHPILLANSHPFTKLIFEYEHKRLLHAGPQLLVSYLRQNYWVISSRRLAKATVHNCVTCSRFNPKVTSPIMGNLPSDRVTPAPPFSRTGVDYAGPFLIKENKRKNARTNKCYICIFVCLVTKALHIELVSDLTTECFIASLRRFISRRGKPSHIYSDNGKNFQGAYNELKAIVSFLQQNESKIMNFCLDENVSWHFIPPHAPNFGGIWESAVKGVKHHIKRTLVNSVLTFEEFTTLLTQIECILNSRPLYPVSSDPNDLEPITPSHFLIGRPLTSLPDINLQDTRENTLSRFQLIQRKQQEFWSRWHKEYLTSLQQRHKWKDNTNNLPVGSMVLIKEDHLPPNFWMIGRITELHLGSDTVARVASVKTSKGIIKRPIRKLCLLPVQ